MAEKLPLVYVDGGLSQLPPGDSIEGVQFGTLTAGSGLVGGGDLSTGNKRLDVALASNASGVIFVGDAIGLDGVAEATATAALASGNAGLVLGETALSSGVVAQGEAATALASGNAALEAAVNFVGSSSLELTAASPISIGSAVGLDDTGSVQAIRDVEDIDSTDPGSPVVFNSARSDPTSIIYDPDNDKVLISYRNAGSTSDGESIVGTVSGTSISFGTPSTFETGTVSLNYLVSVYDTANNATVIAYEDTSNSSYGTAVVATISGTSVSFGTPVVFESSATTHIAIAFDSTSNQVVIGYSGIGGLTDGGAVVGAVSGTSISFGTPVTFETEGTSYISVVYDPVSDKSVFLYRSASGPAGYGIVGTVSGTSISFGTRVLLVSSSITWTSGVFDSTNNKVVFFYSVSSDSYGVVATVSGTTVSFGTPVQFANSSRADCFATNSAYSPYADRIAHFYQDTANSNYGTVILSSVSGTSLSFYSPIVFSSAATYFPSTAYDTVTDSFVTSYRDGGNSNYGTAVVSPFGTKTIPTVSAQTNFLGVSQATVASGTNLNVLLPRAIDTNQTGLTPGSFYYVDSTVSGFTTASGQPSTWSGAYNWGPVGKAVSSSGLLLLNPL